MSRFSRDPFREHEVNARHERIAELYDRIGYPGSPERAAWAAEQQRTRPRLARHVCRVYDGAGFHGRNGRVVAAAPTEHEAMVRALESAIERRFWEHTGDTAPYRVCNLAGEYPIQPCALVEQGDVRIGERIVIFNGAFFVHPLDAPDTVGNLGAPLSYSEV